MELILKLSVVILRDHCCSLRLELSEPSPAMSVDSEAFRIRSASDGDEDLDGSGRNDQQSV